jgi:hypothetical protein
MNAVPLTRSAILTLVALLPACDGADQRQIPERGPVDAAAATQEDPQDAFMARLQAICGQAFEGRLAEGTAPADAAFAGQRMVMHVRECEPGEVRIPLHVGEDRSRTWIITRTEDGIRLKHDHRHEDGTEDEVTQYGGDTRDPGTASAQEFHADAFTAELVPPARTNIWRVEVEPGRHFAYSLRREETDRRVRFEFDLTRPTEAPPAPWGH